MLEWVAISYSRGSVQSRDRILVSFTADRFFAIWATREAFVYNKFELSGGFPEGDVPSAILNSGWADRRGKERDPLWEISICSFPDGWMASLTSWTWVWASSGSWWWTGNPGLLQSLGLQRVRHDWATKLNWDVDYLLIVQIMFEDLKLYVPCCHTETRGKVGLLQLVGHLCLLLRVSDPWMKRLVGLHSKVETSSWC